MERDKVRKVQHRTSETALPAIARIEKGQAEISPIKRLEECRCDETGRAESLRVQIGQEIDTVLKGPFDVCKVFSEIDRMMHEQRQRGETPAIDLKIYYS